MERWMLFNLSRGEVVSFKYHISTPDLWHRGKEQKGVVGVEGQTHGYVMDGYRDRSRHMWPVPPARSSVELEYTARVTTTSQ